MAVVIETVLVGLFRGRLTYRTGQRLLGDTDHPDQVARELAGFPADGEAGRLLHSTSWRFAGGRIVLTYAALPDPDPAAGRPLTAPVAPATGPDPLHPSPARLDLADVAVHACRHLAFLRRTDPVVAAAAALGPPMWRLIEAYRPAVAGAVTSAAMP